MESVVLGAEKFKNCGKGTHGGGRYLFTKTVNQKSVIVLAEVKDEKCWLITGYYED
jgi:hypothetical protein